MAMSYVARVSDGVTQQFDLPFGYLSRQHVFVFVEDALRAFKWISGSRVELLAPALPGEIIKIRRLTERAARVTNYVDGQTLLAGDLNDGDLQNFYIMQELIDQLTDGIALGDVSVLNPDGGWITAQWIADQIDAAAPPDTLLAFANALADEALARAAAIADEALARGAAITAEAAARTAEVLALTTDLEAEAATRTADVLALTTADADQVGRLVIVESDLNTPTTGVKAKLVTVENAITTETSARASADTAILAEIDAPGTGLKARATSLESRTTAVEIGKAEASELTALSARVTTAEADITAAEAAITSEATTRATEDTAIATSVTALAARVTTAEADITAAEAAIVTANSAIATETSARASADTAILAEINDPTTGLKARATSLESRTTSVELNKAEASALTALSSEVNSQAASTNDALNNNAKFAQIHASGIVPPGWADWSAGWVNSSSYAHPSLPGRYGWRHSKTSSDNVNFGIGQSSVPVSGGRKYLLRASARRLSGSFGSSGVYVSFFNASDVYLAAWWVPFATGQTTNGEVVGEYPDGVHTWEAIVTAPAGAVRSVLHPMTGWGDFGASVDVDMLWYECGLYASESPELAAAQAKADIVSEATTRATEDTAIASSVTALTARVTTAESDINAAEAAIVTTNDAIAAETGARTTQVNALDTRVGTAEAGLVTVNSTVADLQTNKAEASAVTALTASVDVVRAASKQVIVSDFNADGFYWTGAFGGTPDAVADHPSLSYADVANIGRVAKTSTFPTYLTPKAAIKPYVGMKLRVEVKLRASVDASGGILTAAISNINGLSSAWEHGSTGATGASVEGFSTGRDVAVADGWVTLAILYTCPSISTYEAGWRPRFDIWRTGGTGGEVEIAYLRIDDVTEVQVVNASANAAIVSESATRASADAAAATTVSNLQASFSGRQILNGNPFFDEGPVTTSGVIPPRWANWASGAASFVEAKPWGGVGLHVRQDSLTGTPINVGWLQDLGHGSVRGSNKYKIRADLARESGSLVSSGVLISWYDAANSNVAIDRMYFGLDADTSGVVSAYGDGRRVWEQIVTAPATATKVVIYAMQAWSGFGGAAQASTPQLRWFECSISHISSETAGVTELREALSTGNSSLARLLLSVNTGTNVATIEAAAFSGDGTWNGSAITLQADLIRLLARNINFGTRTEFEDTRGTIYNTEASKRLRILGPFGASNDLVLWYGLDSVALQSETKTNGIFAIATDGLVYLGASSLSAPMSVSHSGSYVATRFGTGTLNTGSITLTPAGGSGSYTYSHQLIVTSNPDGIAVQLNSPTSATFSISAPSTAPVKAVEYLVVSTVTDSVGRVAQYVRGGSLIWES
jgi:hypothetical protein